MAFLPAPSFVFTLVHSVWFPFFILVFPWLWGERQPPLCRWVDLKPWGILPHASPGLPDSLEWGPRLRELAVFLGIVSASRHLLSSTGVWDLRKSASYSYNYDGHCPHHTSYLLLRGKNKKKESKYLLKMQYLVSHTFSLLTFMYTRWKLVPLCHWSHRPH